MHQSHAEIIEAKGGAEAFAAKIGAEVQEVRVWKSRNKLPRTRWLQIHEAFPDLDLKTLSEAKAGLQHKPRERAA